MPAAHSPKLGRFIAGLWAVNLLALAALALFLTRHVPAAPSPSILTTITNTLTLTQTASVTPTASLTLSPTPSSTFTPSLSPTATLTPIPFAEGPIVIGKSVQGRDMQVYRFGTGPTEYMIVAGMHGGDEYNTVELVDQLMAYILSHPEVIPPEDTLYILHALNPDGVARAKNYLGRVNANGVDLNRNWPDGWKKDWNRDGCWTTTYVTGGKKAASEPEVQALMAFIQAHHFTALINYHAAALGVFPGGLPSTEGSIQLAESIAAISHYKYPPVDTGCEYTGGMVDWTADIGIPSVDLELTNHADTDFDVNLGILQMFLAWKAEG